MKTIREAFDTGARTVYLNNHVQITHLERGLPYSERTCPPKIIDGKPVYRQIFCRITGVTDGNVWEFLKKADRYEDVLGYDFILSEKDMNHFINLCGGIDSYRTDYWNVGWSKY